MGMVAILVMWPQLFWKIWVPLSHEDLIYDLTSICLVASGQKLFEINEIFSDCGQRSKNDLDLWYMYVSMYWLVYYIY